MFDGALGGNAIPPGSRHDTSARFDVSDKKDVVRGIYPALSEALPNVRVKNSRPPNENQCSPVKCSADEFLMPRLL